jgi:hypothetical protein
MASDIGMILEKKGDFANHLAEIRRLHARRLRRIHAPQCEQCLHLRLTEG